MNKSQIQIVIWFWLFAGAFLLFPQNTPTEKIVVVEKVHYIYVPEELIPEKPSKPAEIVEYSEPVPPKYTFTHEDILLLTVLLCGDGNYDGDGEYDIDFGNQENTEQIYLVLNVVMNRVMSDKFPNDISSVVWAPNQFSLMYKWRDGLPGVKDESYAIVKQWCDAYANYDESVITIPTTHLYFTGNGIINKSY